MRRTPFLWRLVLVLVVLAVLVQTVTHPQPVWDGRVGQPTHSRPQRNPRRHALRWAQRRARWIRQHRAALRAERRRWRAHLVRRLRRSTAACPPPAAVQALLTTGPTWHPQAPPEPAPGLPTPPAPDPTAPDPLADLRQRRGWIDQMDERQLWAVLIQVRWPYGPVCPHCGERAPGYLQVLDPDYRGGLGRWRCQVCAEAGDPGEGGTFTPLTGTILDGMRLDVRTLWLLLEAFAAGQASVEAADEARVNRLTSDRLFRLLRAALYQTRPTGLLTEDVEAILECDEVYLTAGLKGQAGGWLLEREPRQRGLKRRGRGAWDNDRLPVFGVLVRGGQVRLIVLRNLQQEHFRPLVRQLIQRGTRVYTDSYSIYDFLAQEGYDHQAVNHSASEYARDLDGDGFCEVHCNTLEGTWSWLRQMIRTYRGVSKVYLPLYVAQFEFLFNRRHENRWNRTLDVLQAAFQVEGAAVTDLLARVTTAEFAAVCPVAG